MFLSRAAVTQLVLHTNSAWKQKLQDTMEAQCDSWICLDTYNSSISSESCLQVFADDMNVGN